MFRSLLVAIKAMVTRRRIRRFEAVWSTSESDGFRIHLGPSSSCRIRVPSTWRKLRSTRTASSRRQRRRRSRPEKRRGPREERLLLWNSAEEKPKSPERSRERSREKSREKSRERSRERRDRSRSRRDRRREERKVVAVSNLSRNVNEEHLKEIFGNYGKVKEANLAIDKTAGLPKGYAYVEFYEERDADRAISHLNTGQIDGNVIRASWLQSTRLCL